VTGTDPIWARLGRLTPARIGLGRAGAALPTREVLRFALDHARARDAVQAALDAEAVEASLAALGLGALHVESAAPDRATYLRRPDLGRRLSVTSRAFLAARDHRAVDLAIVVADGLSAAAAQAHAAPVLAALAPWIARAGWTVAPAVVARQGRVALGDEVGELLRARLVVVMLGERPALSSPDSLGIYLTHGPRPGRTDAERNCISNIRPVGLGHELAAFKLAWLVTEALRLGLTGVTLKDESDLARLEPGVAPRAPALGT
jgi:ethanolamine ammonia-lyase small subunit